MALNPFANYFNQNLGPAVVQNPNLGYDMGAFGADDPQYQMEVAQGIGAGMPVVDAVKNAAQRLFGRQQAAQAYQLQMMMVPQQQPLLPALANFQMPQIPALANLQPRPQGQGASLRPLNHAKPNVNGFGYEPWFQGVGADEDEIGADEEQELGADDLEIEGIAADDEEVYGQDGNVDLEGTFAGIGKKEAKAERKLARLQAKLDGTPQHRKKLRRRIAGQIKALENAMNKKDKKKDALLTQASKRTGMSKSELRKSGMLEGAVAQTELSRARAAMGNGNGGNFEPQAPGQNTVLPFKVSGIPVAPWAIAASAGAHTTSVEMVTSAKTYAKFYAKAIRVFLQLQPGLVSGVIPGDILLNAYATSLVIDGGKNLLYDSIPLEYVGGGRSSVNGSSVYFLDYSLRDGQALPENSVATLQITIRQEITNANTINGTITAGLICDNLYDSSVQR